MSVEGAMPVEVMGKYGNRSRSSLVVGSARSRKDASLSGILVCSRKSHFTLENARLSPASRAKIPVAYSIPARQPDVTCLLTPGVLEICTKIRIATETDLRHVVH